MSVECLRLLDKYLAPVIECLCALTRIHRDIGRGTEPAATMRKRSDYRPADAPRPATSRAGRMHRPQKA